MYDTASTAIAADALHDKRLFKSKHQWRLFVSHIVLVAGGVRDAYLVDGVAVDAEHAAVLIDGLSCALDCPGALCCMALGDDVVVFRADRLRHKVEHTLQPSAWFAARPVTVDIDTGVPHVCEDDGRAEAIRACLVASFAGLDLTASAAPFRVPTTATFAAHVGFPYLAGWLLGYPFVYRATDTTPNGSSSSSGGRSGSESSAGGPSASLSMVSLRKVSVRVTLDGYWAALGVSPAPAVEVWEFTVPTAVLAAPSSSPPPSCGAIRAPEPSLAEGDRDNRDTYGARLQRWIDATQARLAALPSLRVPLGRVEVCCEDVILPSLVV